ncbi:MAG: rod shape-determining protein MreC [Silvibacterium sp.]
MESFFSRYRNVLVLIAVLVAQLLALAVQVKRPAADGADRQSVSLMRHVVVAVITPPERVLHDTGLWFRRLWFGYIDLIHVRRENAGLQREVERLRMEQASISQDAAQGRRLQHMLGFTEHYIYKTQPAQVIGTGGTDQSQVLYIDKGSDDGLEQDMPVITADGIVGKLKDVFPHTSQVLLVTDPTSGVGVILETTRIRGILKGRAFAQLQVTDVSPDSRIKAGETIVTSGGDQIFPRGLSVGTVDRVVPDPEHDPLVDVLVHPAAKLSQLEEVLVITNMSADVSPQEAKDLAESEAEGEAAQKRASDILSERLPSRIDPNAPADTNPDNLVDASGNAVPHPPPPLPAHPDQFSPNAEPDATQMVPGRRWASVKDGTEETKSPAAARQTHITPATSAASALPSGSASHVAASQAPAAVKPAHAAALPGELKTQPQIHVVVDGPETAVHKTEGARPAATPDKPHKGPQVVPDDGSRPPQPVPDDGSRPPQPSPPQGGVR